VLITAIVKSRCGCQRSSISAVVNRGRVDALLRYTPPSADVAERDIDVEVVGHLANWSDRIRAIVSDAEPLQISEILKWPGVMSAPAVDDEVLADAAADLLRGALSELTDSREGEGTALAGILKDKIATARGILGSLTAQLPDIAKAQRQRLEQRLMEMVEQVDPERFAQRGHRRDG